MRSVFTLLFAGCLVGASQAEAQQQGVWVNDSTTMGPSYFTDVYYSLKNGVQKTDSNKNWHLAFEVTPGQNTGVSILANYAQTAAGGGPTATPGIQVWSANKQASTSFSTLTAADTVGKLSEAKALYNNPANWSDGAFNRNRSSSIYDYGWGFYTQTTHGVNGDSLYILKMAGVSYKMTIQKYVATPADSISYTFRIASWDNSLDRTVTIRRSPDGKNANFLYYNILTNTYRNREAVDSTWDMVFTRYGDTAFNNGVPQVYPSMGILSNKGVAVAKVKGATPDTMGYMNRTFLPNANAIGANWKYTTPSFTFDVDTVYYFVKSKNSRQYYMMQFRSFGGSANGKTVFRKMYLGVVANTTSVGNTPSNAPAAFFIAPNPAASDAKIMLDAVKAESARVFITDLTGRAVQSFSTPLNAGLNAFAIQTGNLAAGNYLITVAGADWKQTQQLSVQH